MSSLEAFWFFVCFSWGHIPLLLFFPWFYHLFSSTFNLSVLQFFLPSLHISLYQRALYLKLPMDHFYPFHNQHQQFVINPQSWQLTGLIHPVYIPVFWWTLHYLSYLLNPTCAGYFVGFTFYLIHC